MKFYENEKQRKIKQKYIKFKGKKGKIEKRAKSENKGKRNIKKREREVKEKWEKKDKRKRRERKRKITVKEREDIFVWKKKRRIRQQDERLEITETYLWSNHFCHGWHWPYFLSRKTKRKKIKS